MDRLIQKLKELAIQHPLNTSFKWAVPETCPLSFPENIFTDFDKNIYLKHNFSTLLKSGDLTYRFWLIQEWGGIHTLKSDKKNQDLMMRLDEELEQGELTQLVFSKVSSLSKVAAFLDHINYAIYDSRSIYALNWLLFKYTNVKSLYPQPLGRNKKLSEYELKTIFNLVDRNFTYKNYNIAYHDYCHLLKKLSFEIYGKNEPYWVEMLLFVIAPTYIVEDIKNSLSISLKC